jgi:hypothetical protein
MNEDVFRDAVLCSLIETDLLFNVGWPVPLFSSTAYSSLIMEAVNISETSVNFYKATPRNIPEAIHLHTHRRENLKCHSKEHSVYTKSGKFIEELSNYKVLKKHHSSTPLSYL